MAGISSGSDTWPVLAQGLPWQIMIGAFRCSSSAFAVGGGRQHWAAQPFGALAPRPTCFLGGIKRTISRVFPRPEPIIAAPQRLCDGRRLKVFDTTQSSSVSTQSRRQSARFPTRRVTATDDESLRVVAQLTYLRPVILHPKATQLSQHLACCLTAREQPIFCPEAPMRSRTRTISHST